MKIRFTIWMIFIAAVIGLIGLVHAQGSGPASGKTITLENGEVVADLSGEWDAVIENYGKTFQYQPGTFRNVIKITQEGSSFVAVRTQTEGKRLKGSMFMQGEVDKSGFKKIFYVDFSARLLPCVGQISAAGNEIQIDEGFLVKATLTRR